MSLKATKMSNNGDAILNNKFEQCEGNIKDFITTLNTELLCKIEELNTKVSLLLKKTGVTETTKLVPEPKTAASKKKTTAATTKVAATKSVNKYTLFQRKFKNDAEFKKFVLSSDDIQEQVDGNAAIADEKSDAKRSQKMGTFIWALLKKDDYKTTLSMVEKEIGAEETEEKKQLEGEDQQLEENSDDEQPPLTDKPARN